MTTAEHAIPTRVEPPAKPLSLLRWIRAAVRNPLEVWPEEVYRERVTVARLLGRKALFVMEPELVETILLHEADRYGKTEIIKRVLEPAVGTGIVVSEGNKHRHQRRIVAPSFRPDRIAAFVPEMLAAADREAERLAKYQDGAEISLFQEMMRGTFDTLSETVLSGGHDFDVPAFAKAMDAYLNSTGWVIALAALGLPAGFPYPGRRRRMASRNYVRGITEGLVTKRRKSEPRNDLIQALLNARDDETGAAMNDREIVDNLLSFIAAGHETTALALTWTLYLLSIYPDVEAKVLSEIADAGGPDGVTPEDIAELPYTRQVVNESMRLYPPVPAVIRRPKYSGTLAGFPVNSRQPIIIPIYAIHRHRRLWSDPDSFDPDRFAPGEVKARHRFAFLPFSGGQRTCIGMGFATLEIISFLVKLLPRFKVEPVGPAPTPTAKPSLRPSNGMQVKLHRRTG